MPRTKITALLLARNNDALHLGRALDSLRPCDEVIVVDHGPTDDTGTSTALVAREHGARVVRSAALAGRAAADLASHDWLLCLHPYESLAESLEASLFEFKEEEHASGAAGFNVLVREQTAEGWRLLPPELRLVNRQQAQWTGDMPSPDPSAPLLEGHMLRFRDQK